MSIARLLDVIDPNAMVLKEYSALKTTEREARVRAIMINLMDSFYHKQILKIKDPRQILKNLSKQREIQGNITHTRIKQIL